MDRNETELNDEMVQYVDKNPKKESIVENYQKN